MNELGDDPMHSGSYRSIGVATDPQSVHAAHMRVLADGVYIPFALSLFFAVVGGFFGLLLGFLTGTSEWKVAGICAVLLPIICAVFSRVRSVRAKKTEMLSLLEAEQRRQDETKMKVAMARASGAFDRFEKD